MMNSFLQRILLTLFFLTGIRMNQDAQQIQQLDPYQTELLRLVNAQRAKGCHCGSQKFSPAQPLSWNKQLEKASSIQAQFLAKRKALTHKGQDGLDVRSRLSKQIIAGALMQKILPKVIIHRRKYLMPGWIAQVIVRTLWGSIKKWLWCG